MYACMYVCMLVCMLCKLQVHVQSQHDSVCILGTLETQKILPHQGLQWPINTLEIQFWDH